MAKAEFIEDIERADIDRHSMGLGKERSMNFIFVWGLGFFTEDGSLAYVSSLASRNHLEQRRGLRCYSLELGGLGMELSSSSGLECTYDSFIQSFSPGSSLDVIYSRESLTLCPLQGGHVLFAL